MKLTKARAASNADLFAHAVRDIQREKLSMIATQYLLPRTSALGSFKISILISANGEPDMVRRSTMA
jgi:hypothetical protein